jgi:hypothetical protein
MPQLTSLNFGAFHFIAVLLLCGEYCANPLNMCLNTAAQDRITCLCDGIDLIKAGNCRNVLNTRDRGALPPIARPLSTPINFSRFPARF